MDGSAVMVGEDDGLALLSQELLKLDRSMRIEVLHPYPLDPSPVLRVTWGNAFTVGGLHEEQLNRDEMERSPQALKAFCSRVLDHVITAHASSIQAPPGGPA